MNSHTHYLSALLVLTAVSFPTSLIGIFIKLNLGRINNILPNALSYALFVIMVFFTGYIGIINYSANIYFIHLPSKNQEGKLKNFCEQFPIASPLPRRGVSGQKAEPPPYWERPCAPGAGPGVTCQFLAGRRMRASRGQTWADRPMRSSHSPSSVTTMGRPSSTSTSTRRTRRNSAMFW